jgi:hypothetical protein
MSENILNMFCSKCNYEFAINLPKCPDCGESVTEETKETLIHWASFGILIGIGAIVLAVFTSFPDSPVYRIYQIILFIMGPIFIFSGFRQFLSSRGKILQRGLGSSFCQTGLGLIIFFGWMADAYFWSITWHEEGFMMLLGIVLIGIGLWQFTILGKKPQDQST